MHSQPWEEETPGRGSCGLQRARGEGGATAAGSQVRAGNTAGSAPPPASCRASHRAIGPSSHRPHRGAHGAWSVARGAWTAAGPVGPARSGLLLTQPCTCCGHRALSPRARRRAPGSTARAARSAGHRGARPFVCRVRGPVPGTGGHVLQDARLPAPSFPEHPSDNTSMSLRPALLPAGPGNLVTAKTDSHYVHLQLGLEGTHTPRRVCAGEAPGPRATAQHQVPFAGCASAGAGLAVRAPPGAADESSSTRPRPARPPEWGLEGLRPASCHTLEPPPWPPLWSPACRGAIPGKAHRRASLHNTTLVSKAASLFPSV